MCDNIVGGIGRDLISEKIRELPLEENIKLRIHEEIVKHINKKSFDLFDIENENVVSDMQNVIIHRLNKNYLH